MAGITKGRFVEIAPIIESRYEIRAVKARRRPPEEICENHDRTVYNARERDQILYANYANLPDCFATGDDLSCSRCNYCDLPEKRHSNQRDDVVYKYRQGS